MRRPPPKPPDRVADTFDYVIVGAGAAGCVLAERLSADPAKRVLLIEAGPPDRHPMIHMPRGIAKILSNPAHVWPFTAARGVGDNRPPEYWLRGKVLGGSSATNGMMYVRPQPADFDELAAAAGEHWSWAAMAPIFKAIEDHPLGAADTRGAGGPLRLSLPTRHPLMDGMIAAGAALGMQGVEDVNQPDDRPRIGYCPATIRRGRRQSAARAFLRPARGRPNLTIRTGVTVDRVVFEGTRAIGVEVMVAAGHQRIAAHRVILAGGTLASPAILQRSGIGDGALLGRMGIDVIADRPTVGQGLREHCALAMQWRLDRPLSINAQFSGWRLARNALRYALFQDGPLASAAYDVMGQFMAHPSSTRPDMQLIAAPFSIDKSQPTLAMEREPGMQIALYPLRPRASGSLAIASRDPAVLPAMQLDYFADAHDRETMIHGVRVLRRLVAAASSLAGVVAQEHRPGPTLTRDAAISGAWREMGTTAYHAAGTCRMGVDRDAVVDAHTRVNGVDNLHVVDLSIASQIPAGNTFAPVAAIAWRAADLISLHKSI